MILRETSSQLQNCLRACHGELRHRNAVLLRRVHSRLTRHSVFAVVHVDFFQKRETGSEEVCLQAILHIGATLRDFADNVL